jgi:hypothetical protein
LTTKRNEEILEQMKAEPVDGKLNSLQHVTGMNNSMPKICSNKDEIDEED